MSDHNYFANLIWEIADLLRGPDRPLQYERAMLPRTVVRRFDCVLAPTKAKVLTEHDRWSGKLKAEALDAKLMVTDISRETGQLEVLSAVTARTVSPLNEHRAALIAAEVSGQIPVPEVSA